MIPYGRQSIDEEDIQAVVEVLRSDWLTTGPKVDEFERAFADFVGANEAVAVCNGTAALHATTHALGIEPGDEVIVPPITFASTASCIVFQGGVPVFADVDPNTLLIDPGQAEAKITPRTKAIIAVDYTAQPCDYEKLQAVADQHDLALVADACHSLGGAYRDRPVGSLADLNVFSFHPVKHITTGEGGMITTDDTTLASRLRMFRNHGITTDHRQREELGSWFYEMVNLGYNYRITDFQCALGLSQLRKLPGWLEQRQEIVRRYNQAFSDLSTIVPLEVRPEVTHAYHLYVIQLELGDLQCDRGVIFSTLRNNSIGVNVHYIPVHLHPFYREHFATKPGDCPIAESAYERLLTLPIHPRMSSKDIDEVVNVVRETVSFYLKEKYR
jgi:perosamine synthetase